MAPLTSREYSLYRRTTTLQPLTLCCFALLFVLFKYSRIFVKVIDLYSILFSYTIRFQLGSRAWLFIFNSAFKKYRSHTFDNMATAALLCMCIKNSHYTVCPWRATIFHLCPFQSAQHTVSSKCLWHACIREQIYTCRHFRWLAFIMVSEQIFSCTPASHKILMPTVHTDWAFDQPPRANRRSRSEQLC